MQRRPRVVGDHLEPHRVGPAGALAHDARRPARADVELELHDLVDRQRPLDADAHAGRPEVDGLRHHRRPGPPVERAAASDVHARGRSPFLHAPTVARGGMQVKRGAYRPTGWRLV